MNFDKVNLHDATISEITYDWLSKEALVTGKCFNPLLNRIVNFQLKFTRVNSIEIPHSSRWGESSSIYKTFEDKQGTYCIEVQSGDILKFRCESYFLDLEKKQV